MSGKTPLKLQAALANYQAARQAIDAFRLEHADVFEEFEELIRSHDTAVVDVRSEYAKNWATVGKKFEDFSVQVRRDVNVPLLYEYLSDDHPELFDLSYKLRDRNSYNRAVRDGVISTEILGKVETEVVIVKGPNKIGT